MNALCLAMCCAGFGCALIYNEQHKEEEMFADAKHKIAGACGKIERNICVLLLKTYIFVQLNHYMLGLLLYERDKRVINKNALSNTISFKLDCQRRPGLLA